MRSDIAPIRARQAVGESIANTPTCSRTAERIRTTLNFYDYAAQNPINEYDLSGECSPLKCLKKLVKIAKKVGSAVKKSVGPIAHTVVGTAEQVPNTLNAAAKHPGTFAASAAGYSLGIAAVASGVWLAAEIAGAESPGLLAQLAHPSDVGFGFLYGATPALIPGYVGYKGSEKLAGGH